MKELGIYLKELRINHGYSQDQVFECTGITDSQQSRIERGLNQTISPTTLKRFANFYGICVIDLYLLTGFLSKEDITQYKQIFKYAELLTEKQKKNIQEEINLFTQGNGGNNNAI